MICVKCRVEADAIMENLKFFKEITKMKQVSYKTLQALFIMFLSVVFLFTAPNEGAAAAVITIPRPKHTIDAPRPAHTINAPRPKHTIDTPRPAHTINAPRPKHTIDAPRPTHTINVL